MKRNTAIATVLVAAAIGILISVAFAAQDKSTVKSPNGIVFSEFKGYESWEAVAMSEPEEVVNVISANSVMIDAYKSGIPRNGKPFPDGSMIAKIAWNKEQNPESPYKVTIPGTLKMISFIQKDSKRFPETDGWGYAQFLYDSKSDTFTPHGTDASFAKNECHKCHTRVKAKDFIYTRYAPR